MRVCIDRPAFSRESQDSCRYSVEGGRVPKGWTFRCATVPPPSGENTCSYFVCPPHPFWSRLDPRALLSVVVCSLAVFVSMGQYDYLAHVASPFFKTAARRHSAPRRHADKAPWSQMGCVFGGLFVVRR